MMPHSDIPHPPGKRHTAPSETQNPQLLMAQQALRGNIQEGLAVAQETEGKPVQCCIPTSSGQRQCKETAITIATLQTHIHVLMYPMYCSLDCHILSQASVKWKQTTLDVSRQNVSSALAAMLAATASVITLTGGEPTDINYTALGSSVTTM